jgi:glyoxylase-like metal-dependent hydrolase (beta-lactamase superfamily II)
MRTGLRAITPGIWLIQGQKMWGEPYNPYAIARNGAVYLIDCPQFADDLLRELSKLGKVTGIYLTHAATSGPCRAWQAGNIPVWLNALDGDDQWLEIKPDHWFDDDADIAPGLRAIHMPGHSKGHTMFLHEANGGSLFSGDAILLVSQQVRLEIDERAQRRLRRLSFDCVLPYHGAVLERHARERVMEALEAAA